MIEDYVSFEVAKLLKDKGFDECPLFCYDDCGQLWVQGGYDKTKKWHFPAPTLQMAMKWLREKYHIFICTLFLENEDAWGFTIEDTSAKKYLTTSRDTTYESYEVAAEAAIKYCLEKLI